MSEAEIFLRVTFVVPTQLLEHRTRNNVVERGKTLIDDWTYVVTVRQPRELDPVGAAI
jgi:hypothetical protein